jgi:hypothetical protein
MGNFIKLMLALGFIGVLSFLFAVFVYDKKDAEMGLEKARFDREAVEFDKRFYESWDMQKKEMADTPEARDFWNEKIEDDRKTFAEKEKQADERVEKAQANLEQPAADQRQFVHDTKKAVESTNDEITEQDFEKALKESFNR